MPVPRCEGYTVMHDTHSDRQRGIAIFSCGRLHKPSRLSQSRSSLSVKSRCWWGGQVFLVLLTRGYEWELLNPDAKWQRFLFEQPVDGVPVKISKV